MTIPLRNGEPRILIDSRIVLETCTQNVLVDMVQPFHYIAPMPTIKRFHNCWIEIRFRDHNPPHFHVVMNDGREALVEIENLAMAMGRVRKSQISEALVWAADNIGLIREKWKEYNP